MDELWDELYKAYGLKKEDTEFGVLIDQELYGLVDKFKQYIPPKDFEKLIPDIHQAQTKLQLAYNKLKKRAAK